MSGELLHLQEHLSCRNYVSDYRCNFLYRDIKSGNQVDLEKQYNYLMFLLEGEVIVNCNEFVDRHFKKDDIFFMPRAAETKIIAATDCKLMVCVFDVMQNACEKFNLHSCWVISKDLKYDFQPIKIIPQVEAFLAHLIYCLNEGVKCEHFHSIMQQEMTLILRWFYPREQLAQLFYPILGQSIDFKAFVLDNHMKVKNSQELANLSMMGRSSFDIKFKAEFGMPPGQWMLKQKAKHIKIHMAMPGVNISDIMIKFDFNSATHFTRFCKQHFGCPPSELMAKLQAEELKKIKG